MKTLLIGMLALLLTGCVPENRPTGIEVRYTFDKLEEKNITVCASLGSRIFVIKRFDLHQPQRTEYITRVEIPKEIPVTKKSSISLQCDRTDKSVRLLESKFLY